MTTNQIQIQIQIQNHENKRENIPLMEKYRPSRFEDIVLDPINKKILKNIIETCHFPNLLFFGPPGTGKTTTIINLINYYQEKTGEKGKGLMIHLNASDERGIDIIRNQINQFVNSKTLFNKGMKFVVLDEVDYMTKEAQQALRCLLQYHTDNVRFCLICNYISRIDEGLQNEFLRLRFNQLPKEDIVVFLKHISSSEKLQLTQKQIEQIQQLHKSDVRSMINFMQSNQIHNDTVLHVIDASVWEKLCQMLECKKTNMSKILDYVDEIGMKYNIDKKNTIKDFLNYIIRNRENVICEEFLNFVENIMHFEDCRNSHYVNYSISMLSSFMKK
jgi:DNA polymerase III delta prime subunit